MDNVRKPEERTGGLAGPSTGVCCAPAPPTLPLEVPGVWAALGVPGVWAALGVPGVWATLGVPGTCGDPPRSSRKSDTSGRTSRDIDDARLSDGG
jgi:hypothetical protein